MKNDSWFVTYLKKNPLQVTLQLFGVVIIILNIWLTTKLAPLAQNIGLLNLRVDAMEKEQTVRTTDHDDIQQIKATMLQVSKNIENINNNVNHLLYNK